MLYRNTKRFIVKKSFSQYRDIRKRNWISIPAMFLESWHKLPCFLRKRQKKRSKSMHSQCASYSSLTECYDLRVVQSGPYSYQKIIETLDFFDSLSQDVYTLLCIFLECTKTALRANNNKTHSWKLEAVTPRFYLILNYLLDTYRSGDTSVFLAYTASMSLIGDHYYKPNNINNTIDYIKKRKTLQVPRTT